MQYREIVQLALAGLISIYTAAANAETQLKQVAQSATPATNPTPATTVTPAAATPVAVTTTPNAPEAQPTPSKFKIALAIGSDDGGETLMSGTYSNGTKWDIRSNSGYVAKAGFVIPTSDFETQLMIGYKSDSTSASNGKVGFNNIQFEVVESYHPQDFRVGLGAAYIANSQFEVSIPGGTTNGTYRFKDTTGIILQVGWAPKGKIYSVDLRYTAVKFTPSNFTTSSFTGAKSEYSGNVIGLIGGISF